MSEALFEYPSPFIPGEDGQPTNQVDFDQLQPLVDKKLIKANCHPELPYTIYNYSAVRSRRMDTPEDPIIDVCRGLIVDDDGLVIARPFRRMTELGEHEELPEGPRTVYEKIDGSLGVQYRDANGELRMASRGNFIGRHAIAGTEMLQEYQDYPFDPDLTYVWEMTFPEGKLSVDYGTQRRITLLGNLVTATGVEKPLPDQSEVPFPVVKTFEGEEFASASSMRALDWPNAEGFVVRMHENGERYKVKFPSFRWLTMDRKNEVPDYLRRKLLEGRSLSSVMGRVPPSVRPMMGQHVDVLRAEIGTALEPVMAALRGEEVELDPKQQQVLNTMRRAGERQALELLVNPPKRRHGNRQ